MAKKSIPKDLEKLLRTIEEHAKSHDVKDYEKPKPSPPKPVPYLKESNELLQRSVEGNSNRIPDLSVPKKKKIKNPKIKPLRTAKVVSPESFENNFDFPENEPPNHCWAINKIKFNGTWYTPQWPWSGVEIQSFLNGGPGIDPNPVPNPPFFNPPIIQYPLQGPFLIADMCPTTLLNFPNTPYPGLPPLGSAAWWNYVTAPQNWTYRFHASMVMFDFATANNNGIPPVYGDFMVWEESGPSYVTADTVDDTFPAEPIEAWCLEYRGQQYTYPGDDPSTTQVESYKDILALMSGHNITMPFPVSTEGCDNPPARPTTDPCREIGDVNPDTGGILFAKPFTPSNPTPYHYEVAPTDVNIVQNAFGSTDIMPPGGTPFPAISLAECSIAETDEIMVHHTTSNAYSYNHFNQTTGALTYTPTGPTNSLTGPLANPWPAAIQFNAYVVAIGPGSDNPTIDASNYTNWVDVGSEMHHFDVNGDPCFLYDVSGGLATGWVCDPNAINEVSLVFHVPANQGTWTVPGANMYAGNLIHPTDLLVIAGTPGYTNWNWDDSPFVSNPVNTLCPGHNWVIQLPNGTIVNSSAPNGNLPVWKTKFIKKTPASTTGWPVKGLEWGVYNDHTTPALLNPGAFGSGYKNTITIDSYQQPTVPPLNHPTVDTRHIAATEALHYNIMQQLPPIDEEEQWHLPSLDEFLVMINSVGPDAPVHNLPWNTPALNPGLDEFRNSFHNNVNVSVGGGNFVPNTGMSEHVYWTSSDKDVGSVDPNGNIVVNSSLQVAEPLEFAIAVKLRNAVPTISSTHSPEPIYAKRCSLFTVRPIRRYLCDSVRPEDPPKAEYNYRDSHNVWVKGDQGGPHATNDPNEQLLTPFISVYTAGGAGSGRGGIGTTPQNVMQNGCEGIIGKEFFTWSLASTDVMGNEYSMSDFCTHNEQDQPNGKNIGGFYITMWDNQKNYIGKWHYARSRPRPTSSASAMIYGRPNLINWKGYLRDCANHPSPIQYQNCNPSPSYNVHEKEFPRLYQLQFSDVTHIDGPNPEFRYGGNRSEAQRGYWGSNTAINTSDQCPGVPFTDWHHPYMENVFNGWTASYCYIKVECQETLKFGAQAFNPLNGPNTAIDEMEVVCLRNLFKDTYQGYSPPNPGILKTTGGILGCGDISSGEHNDGTGTSGPWASGLVFGEQFVAGSNPNARGNTNYGDVYNINYSDGRSHQPGFPTNNTPPNLALHPKHYVFPWHAAFKPNSGGVNWYQNLHDGYNSCYGYRCGWNLGDVGPAGGIIVAVPNMTGWEHTPNGAATNNSDWYYEMSAHDLGEWVDPAMNNEIEFGANGVTTLYQNWPNNAEFADNYGGNQNTSFDYDSPYTPIGSGIAETTLYPHSMLATNPVGGPFVASNAQSAFRLCDEYLTYDQFGNQYCDWYLPNINEMWFICNNIPSISTDSNPLKNLYWTSNEYVESNIWHPGTFTPGWDELHSNIMYDHGFGFVKGSIPSLSILRPQNAAYAVNVNEKITKWGPGAPGPAPVPTPAHPDWYALDPKVRAAYAVTKFRKGIKVRAIRRFKCPSPGPGSGPPGT